MAIDLETFREAAARIHPYVKRTPLFRSDSLSERFAANVFVKYELFQKTGSFKPRGAFNKLLQLSDEERGKGVIAVSGGNHAQAVAYASRSLGIDAVIAMPSNTPENYLDATRGYGARIELTSNIAEAFELADRYRAEGRVAVHPFDDDQIIAGQGTVGLEIVEGVPDVTDIFVSIGGGGLAAGVAMAVKGERPDVRVFGVETEGADAMAQAIDAGEPVTLPGITSIAKTLGAPYVTTRTLDYARRFLESVTVVSDREAVRELIYIAERLKVVAEPAASCTIAAAEKLKREFSQSSNVVFVLCGGNVSIADICSFRQMIDH